MSYEASSLVEIVRERQKQFPNLLSDQSNISDTLISLFTALDEKYFELSNNHIALKEELQRKILRLEEIEPEFTILNQSKQTLQNENTSLRGEITELNSKLNLLQETNHLNEAKLHECSAKILEQQKLLIHQSEQLSQLSHKCTQFQQVSYTLEQKIKEATAQKELLKKSLHEQIMEIQNVRERQKTQIHDVTSSIKQYQETIEALKQENKQLELLLSQTEVEIKNLNSSLQTLKDTNHIISEQNTKIKVEYQELQLLNKLLTSKEEQLDTIKDEYSALKQKEGNFDMILQNLSTEKQKLNRQINRMTIEAKEQQRKLSDSESINTDTAFDNVTESFRMVLPARGSIIREQNVDLNKSYQDCTSRKLSVSMNLKMGLATSDLAINHNQERIIELENSKRQLEKVVRNLREQLDEGHIGQSAKSQEVMIVDSCIFSEKGDDENQKIEIDQTIENQSKVHRVVQTYSISIRPDIKLYSLFSIPPVKIKPKHKIQSSSQTEKIEESVNKFYPGVKLSFDEIQIEHKTSSSKKEESFLDRLSRMFCGGPDY